MNREFPIADTLEIQMKLEELARKMGGDDRAMLYKASSVIRQLDLLRVHIRACVRD